MKVSFLTLGCKVNQAESLEWERALFQQGHQIVVLDDKPDVCIVNTCTVTGRSDYESRRLIRKAEKAGAKVMVTGCYAQLNSEFVSKMPGVAYLVENNNKDQIISLLEPVLSADRDFARNSGSRSIASRTRKFLKIQDGCEYSCTYCLVWKARGKSRSVDPDTVIERARKALDDGYKEIVLTGVHLGLYGKDLGTRISLSSLINDIISKVSVPSIRLSSLEVNEIDQGLLDLIRSGHVCKHLHVPLQSGDSDVLKAMGRNYTATQYRDRILEIYEVTGDIALGTDIIVGFPTETEEFFQNTVDMVNELPFTYLHVFPYSSRPGTVASGFSDIVGDEERKHRASVLREMSRKKKVSFAQGQVGQNISVLVEECHESGIGQGTSESYLKVSAPLSQITKGSLVLIHVDRADGDHLFGKLLETQ